MWNDNLLKLESLKGLNRTWLRGFCRRWKVSELAVFGSAIRNDFRRDSDVDFLISFAPDAAWSLLDVVRMQYEIEDKLGRSVDLVSRNAVERSSNPYRKEAILGTAETLYAS